MALCSILLQRFVKYAFELRRKIRIHLSYAYGRAIQNSVVNHGSRVAGEGGLPGRHFVQHKSQGKNVRTRIERLAAYLLRRHIARGSQCNSSAREV